MRELRRALRCRKLEGLCDRGRTDVHGVSSDWVVQVVINTVARVVLRAQNAPAQSVGTGSAGSGADQPRAPQGGGTPMHRAAEEGGAGGDTDTKPTWQVSMVPGDDPP